MSRTEAKTTKHSRKNGVKEKTRREIGYGNLTGGRVLRMKEELNGRTRAHP